MPCAIMSRTTWSLAVLVVVSTHLSDLTAITRPGKAPGMPGAAAGEYRETIFRGGRSERICNPSGDTRPFAAKFNPAALADAAAAVSRRTNALRSIKARSFLIGRRRLYRSRLTAHGSRLKD